MGGNYFKNNRCEKCYYFELCEASGVLPAPGEERCEDYFSADEHEYPLELYGRLLADRRDVFSRLEEEGYWE